MPDNCTDILIAELRYKLEVMEAYKNGSPIEVRLKSPWSDKWTAATNPAWCWQEYEYRVKKIPRELWGVEAAISPRGVNTLYQESQKRAILRNNPNAKFVLFREVLED